MYFRTPRFFVISFLLTAISGAEVLAAGGATESDVLTQMNLLQAEFPTVQMTPMSDGQVQATFSIEGSPVTVDLRPHRIRSANFKVYTTDGQGNRTEAALPPETTYRGTVVDLPEVKVAASIRDGKLTALLQDQYNRMWAIEPSPSGSPNPYTVYQAHDIAVPPSTCGAGPFLPERDRQDQVRQHLRQEKIRPTPHRERPLLKSPSIPITNFLPPMAVRSPTPLQTSKT